MIFVPESLRAFAAQFPVPLYLVGGYVRDAVCGVISQDIDICSSLPAEEVKNLLSGTEYRISLLKRDTGSVSILSDETEWQYTAFRTDVYEKGHTPKSIRPADITGDALRRDFRANAVYYDIKNDCFVDPLGGLEDVKKRVFSTTRPPKEVFSEDGLRLMRLARLASETGFSVDERAMEGARENAEKIKEIAPERIRVELERILHSPVPSVGLEILRKEGVLQLILPEIAAGYGLEQRKDYHKYDVFYHTLATVDAADTSVRTAALFHDVGKPVCFFSTGVYYRHDVVGAETCRDIMRRLRYSNKEIEETKRLVLYHMIDISGDMKENKIRKFVQKNADILTKLCLLKDADRIGCGYCKEGQSPASIRLRKTLEQMKAEGVPFSVRDLRIRGDEIPEETLPKDKRGEALCALLAACAEVGTPLTTKEKQLQYILQYSKGRN